MSLISKKIIIKGADFSPISITTETFSLQSIAVTNLPNKTYYAVGESFNPTGMVVTATLKGNDSGNIITRNVTNYTYNPTVLTVVGTNTITITYTLNGVTKTTTLEVTVASLTTYSITTNITNGTSTGDSIIAESGTATVVLSPDSNYKLPSSITVVGASYSYNNLTGSISLSNPTQNVSITATCELVETVSVELEIGAFTGSGGGTSTTPPIIESSSQIRLRTPNNEKIEVGNGLTITASDYEEGCGFCVFYYANISDTQSPYYEEWAYANPRVVSPNANYPYVRIMVKPYADNRMLNNSMIPTEEARITIYKN